MGTGRKSIWFHLHFWIGWISAIPIAIICATGALLAFEETIFEWEHKELYQLDAVGPALSVAQVLERYNSEEPRLQVNHLGLPRSPRHAYSAYCTEIKADGSRRGTRIFLNPYSGELKRMGEEFSIAETITDLHRHLAGGKTGQFIVAVSSVVLGITSVIGLVLWWPLRGRTFARAWRRGQALDWHNALGLVVLFPLAVMAVTGITFTWGRQIFPVLERIQGYSSNVRTPLVSFSEASVAQPIDEVVERVGFLLPGVRISGVQPSHARTQPHVFIMDSGRPALRLYMDPYSGEELARFDGSGTGPVGWYRSYFGVIHTLGPYGVTVRAFWGLLSFGGALLVGTGVWVSVKRWRRSKGRVV